MPPVALITGITSWRRSDSADLYDVVLERAEDGRRTLTTSRAGRMMAANSILKRREERKAPLREHHHVAIGGARPGNHPINSSAHLLRRLAARASVPENQPARNDLVNFCRALALRSRHSSTRPDRHR